MMSTWNEYIWFYSQTFLLVQKVTLVIALDYLLHKRYGDFGQLFYFCDHNMGIRCLKAFSFNKSCNVRLVVFCVIV